MQTIKLYHISYDTTESLKKEFIPRIPENIATGEDKSIPRICLCDSIERCINAAEDNFGDYEEEDKAIIIVWEHEFCLFDDKLLCWQHLYENNLVPDAALTHEYWYLDTLQMTGNYYEIININDAIFNKRLVYIINPKYKEKVLQVFNDYGIDTSSISNFDLYTLVNEWLPSFFPNEHETIIDKLKKEIRIVDDSDNNDLTYGDNVLNIYPQKVYHNLVIIRK
ncbi:MAG: hypothetical protein E7573_06935 [Ruminococcaceae bacterium]|nr:hypothetical protein [Oscillospiraceae bacterium]